MIHAKFEFNSIISIRIYIGISGASLAGIYSYDFHAQYDSTIGKILV